MTVMLWLFSMLEQNMRYITVGSENIFPEVEKHPHIAPYNTRQLPQAGGGQHRTEGTGKTYDDRKE